MVTIILLHHLQHSDQSPNHVGYFRSSLNHRDVSSSISHPSQHKKPSHPMKERSLTSLSLQVKKPKLKANRAGGKDGRDPGKDGLHKSPSLQKISPLQHYILEQAKLSGYRFGDKIQSDKRDSYIDSENESHRTGELIHCPKFLLYKAPQYHVS